MASTSSLIPEGYTFLNSKTFISIKARDLTVDFLKKADDRNPDYFDMYIYNDFHAYGVLSLFDKALSTLHSKVHKKDWKEALTYAEAVTHFINYENTFLMCDDPDRVEVTNTAYGAMIIAILRALKADNCLNVEHFPSLETFLGAVADWSKTMKGQGYKSEYGRVCKATGKRLFQNKSENEKALEKARVEEWKSSLSKDNEEEDEDDEDEDEDEDEDNGRPWFSGAKLSDEDRQDSNFALARVWKVYKDYLKNVSTCPLRGPPKWDLNTWSAAEKRPFLLSNMDGMDDVDDFFF